MLGHNHSKNNNYKGVYLVKIRQKREKIIKVCLLTFIFKYYVPVQEFQLIILMLLLQRLKYHMTPSKLNGCEDHQNRQNFSRNLSIIPATKFFWSRIWKSFLPRDFLHACLLHTTYSWNIKWQKCAGMGLNGFIFRKIN